MRSKYSTRAIVLSRTPHGEANLLLTLLTHDLGLVRARAQGVRKSHAKLASALATFVESEVMLVRGAEGWRLVGAVASEDWFRRLGSEERARAIRTTALLTRLASEESLEPRLYEAVHDLFDALAARPQEEHDAAEILTALRTLSVLGLDAGEVPQREAAHEKISASRGEYVARINRGISASGL